MTLIGFSVYADTVVRYVRHEAFYDVMLFYVSMK